MRIVSSVLLCLLMLLLPLAVLADEEPTDPTTQPTEAAPADEIPLVNDKTLSFVMENGSAYLQDSSSDYAFWEYPLLPAGGVHQPGTLTLRNSTQNTIHLYLDAITLPYGDEEALDYYAALQITVREGNTILYQGAYSRINDDPYTVRTDFLLEPGQSRVWEISLSCPFTYSGDVRQFSQPCVWNFRATARTRQTGSSEIDDSWKNVAQLLIPVAVVALIVCIVAAIVHRYSKRAG